MHADHEVEVVEAEVHAVGQAVAADVEAVAAAGMGGAGLEGEGHGEGGAVVGEAALLDERACEDRCEGALDDVDEGFLQDDFDAAHEGEELHHGVYGWDGGWDRECEHRHQPCESESRVGIF